MPFSAIGPLLAEFDPVAERRDRRGIEHDLALVGVVLGFGQVVDQPPGEHVDELDLRVADDEPASRSRRNGDLQRKADDGTTGRDDLADPAHRVLHREARLRSPGAPSSPSIQHVIASPEK